MKKNLNNPGIRLIGLPTPNQLMYFCKGLGESKMICCVRNRSFEILQHKNYKLEWELEHNVHAALWIFERMFELRVITFYYYNYQTGPSLIRGGPAMRASLSPRYFQYFFEENDGSYLGAEMWIFWIILLYYPTKSS